MYGTDDAEKVARCLLRGFALTSADCFGRCIDALGEPPMTYLHGTSPRSHVDREICTSTEAPPALPIPLHNQMSYRRPCPRYIAFFCETAPRVQGATPLIDMRRVVAEGARRQADGHALSRQECGAMLGNPAEGSLGARMPRE